MRYTVASLLFSTAAAQALGPLPIVLPGLPGVSGLPGLPNIGSLKLPTIPVLPLPSAQDIVAGNGYKSIADVLFKAASSIGLYANGTGRQFKTHDCCRPAHME